LELSNEYKNINRGYKTLDVWKLSVELSIEVRTRIKEIPNLSLKLKGQIEDSAVSVSSNIAEGYSRRHLKEYIQHLNYSLASLSENYTQILIITKSGDIDEVWFEEYNKKHYEIENKLLALVKSLIKKLKEKGNWNTDYKISEIIESYDSQ